MIEIGKTYRTRDGRKVRLLTTDSRCYLGPVIGEYESCGQWVIEAWDREGVTQPANPNLDLIEIKPVRVFEAWVNVYQDGSFITYGSLKGTERYRGELVIATLHIRQAYREGDGLCDDSAKI
jgi:hypothetical protein